MTSDKRNIDSGDVSKSNPGPIRAGGTGSHRRENQLAEEDRQRRDAAAELCEDDPGEPMTDAQAEQLRLLCEEVGEVFDPSLSRDAAEHQIRRLQRAGGYKP